MYKIAVIGDKDSVLAFKILGVDVFVTLDAQEARKTINLTSLLFTKNLQIAIKHKSKNKDTKLKYMKYIIFFLKDKGRKLYHGGIPQGALYAAKSPHANTYGAISIRL